MQALTALLQILANIFGLAKNRQEANNTPEMKRSADARVDAKIADEARDAIADKDLEKIRKLTSE